MVGFLRKLIWLKLVWLVVLCRMFSVWLLLVVLIELWNCIGCLSRVVCSGWLSWVLVVRWMCLRMCVVMLVMVCLVCGCRL